MMTCEPANTDEAGVAAVACEENLGKAVANHAAHDVQHPLRPHHNQCIFSFPRVFELEHGAGKYSDDDCILGIGPRKSDVSFS